MQVSFEKKKNTSHATADNIHSLITRHLKNTECEISVILLQSNFSQGNRFQHNTFLLCFHLDFFCSVHKISFCYCIILLQLLFLALSTLSDVLETTAFTLKKQTIRIQIAQVSVCQACATTDLGYETDWDWF